MARTKLLIVDDEADIREILEFNLKNEGFETDAAASAEDALKVLSSSHSLIILDVMMGGMSGFHMAEQLRNDGNKIPIIFLTARDTENDMLTGFSTGGDDYVSKPFSIKELSARVKAVLKRSSTSINHMDANQPVTEASLIDWLRIDEDSKQVFVEDKAVKFTKKEYEILHLLVKKSPHVFAREKILDKIWSDESYVLERTVDVHVNRLRKKLGKYGNCIINRSGYGYCFVNNLIEQKN